MTASDNAPLPPAPQTRTLPNGHLAVAAPAKINLNLLVGPRRSDGFHGVDSYVSKVTLYDFLDLHPREDGQIRFSCSGADCGSDQQNLALRAARLLAEGRDIPGADLALLKHIPPGRGLGGGSSDAAAALIGLNELWHLGLSVDDLMPLAASLGSDVPLFLGGHACRLAGRGELISPLAVHPFWAILYLGPFACSTAEVYRAFDALPAPAGSHAWPHGQLDSTLLQTPPSQWRGRMVNQLLPAAQTVTPALAEACRRLQSLLGVPLCMSGSGSALFVLADSPAEGQNILATLPSDLRAHCRLVAQNPW